MYLHVMFISDIISLSVTFSKYSLSPFAFTLSPSGSPSILHACGPDANIYTRSTRPLLIQPASARWMQVLCCLLSLCSGSAGDSFVTLINPRRLCTQQDIIADVVTVRLQRVYSYQRHLCRSLAKLDIYGNLRKRNIS